MKHFQNKTKFCSVFFRILNRKFNEDFKNVLKTVIFLLQMGFTVDFVPDCLSGVQSFTPFFSLTVLNFEVFFQVIE